MSWRFLLCALAGLCVGRSQWEGWAALGFVALAPLFVGLRGARPMTAAAAGSLVGIVGALHLYGVAAYGGTLWLGLMAYCGVSTGLMSLLFVLATRHRSGASWWPPVALALAWVCAEWQRGLGPISFPTSLAGAQAGFGALVQAAALIGEAGLSFAMAWFAAALGQAVLSRTEGRSGGVSLPLSAGCLLLLTLGGALRLAQAPPAQQTGPTVAGVQAGGAPWLYRVAPFDRRLGALMRERYITLTRRAFETGADAVLWPEHAFWDTVADDAELRALSLRLAAEAGRPLVFASTRREGPGRRLSSALVASPEGELRALHDKTQLAPIVEADLSPGQARAPAALPGAPALGAAGVLICVESLYPQHARLLADAGAAWLAVLTNDAGFLRSPIAQIHTDRAVLRAVAAGRPLIRVAQAGISLGVDPWGRSQSRLGLFEAGIVQLRLDPPVPVWATWVAPAWGPAALGLLLLAVLSRRGAR